MFEVSALYTTVAHFSIFFRYLVLVNLLMSGEVDPLDAIEAKQSELIVIILVFFFTLFLQIQR